MALLLDPRRTLSALRRAAKRTARRVLGTDGVAEGELRRVTDDLPRDTLFAQPLVVRAEVLGDPEPLGEDGDRVTFRVLVRDANGKRCADVHVEARVSGPERSAVGEATTDMLGAARFRMTGPPGHYAIDVLEVAALALDWDRDASTTTAAVTVP